MDRMDTQDRADYVLSAMRGVVSLMSAQTPNLGVESDKLSELWSILVEEAAKVMPVSARHPSASNGNFHNSDD